MTKPRVLVSTIAPGNGGVFAMTRFMVETLSSRGYEPVIAHYAPYSVDPNLSVPSFRLFERRPGAEQRTFDGYETHALGAWLPELEFTHYLARKAWRQLMETCSAYVAVSGNILAATPFYQTGRAFVAWIATGRAEDRLQRAQTFPLARRVVDAAVVSPIATVLERAVIRRGTVLPISRYTQRSLREIAGRDAVGEVMPVPVDTGFFTPRNGREVVGRVGFAGRLTDPRKNVALLIRAAAAASTMGQRLSVVLIGDTGPDLRQLIGELGLTGQIEIVPSGDRAALRDWLRSLDVCVVPSHQEGLCIVALEAMACGCPVVSTRCGGPEEFVIHGETGFLVRFDPAEMAGAILAIVGDRKLRWRLGQAGRTLVERQYSAERARSVFWQSFSEEFPAAGAALSESEYFDTREPRPVPPAAVFSAPTVAVPE